MKTDLSNFSGWAIYEKGTIVATYDKENFHRYYDQEEIRILQQENKQLIERIDKAIEWVHKHISKYNCKGITIIDWDELSNPNDLLETLGDKE